MPDQRHRGLNMSKKVIVSTIPRRRITPTSSSAVQSNRTAKSSSFYTVKAMEGLVTAAYSEDHSVDIDLESGVKLTRIPVQSRSPIGENDDRGFGERYLPMVNSRVYVDFPAGPNNPDQAVVLSGFFQKADSLKQELLVAGTESIARKITEDGLDISHDRETGLITVIDPDGLEFIVDRENKTISLKPWSDDTFELSDTSIDIDFQGNTITIDSTGLTADFQGNSIVADSAKVTINSLEVLK